MNSSENYSLYELSEENSPNPLSFVRLVNIYTSICIISVGLVGNLIVAFVFGKEKIQSNPSHIFVFCSSIVDSLFLVTHLFEVNQF